MNNELWDRNEMLPPQLVQDLSSLRESIQTNELLRAKLRKQLLSDISSAASDRPGPVEAENQSKRSWKWGAIATGAVALISWITYSFAGSSDTSETANHVEVVQQRQIFAMNSDWGTSEIRVKYTVRAG
ncbi:hypothetical protein [Effusibacillus consociatus]|uniref:DUF4179 domain-containing protein n=1 Tax=Effusibacillus consociatus TaxID=1117041 RepID=A0ABV9Q3Z7_9BACL